MRPSIKIKTWVGFCSCILTLLDETEEEETCVQEARCRQDKAATATATAKCGPHHGEEDPQKLCVFAREVAWSSQTASDGPEKVDASVHCSQPQGEYFTMIVFLFIVNCLDVYFNF